MKDSLLIDSKFSINFWAKVMDATNYLQNWLLTKQADKMVIVPKEAWISTKQNIKYIRIFGSKVSTHIPIKKHFESYIRKT